MRIPRLPSFIIGLALSAALPACQPDKPASTEQRTPALADSLALDSLSDPVGALDTTPVRRDWHRLARPTRRNAPLIVYRSVRRAPAGLQDTAPPPGEATLFDLARKASEYFQIDPTQAAEVRGRDGTIVRISAGTLVDAQQKAATGPVWVELKECLTPAEMVLTNLSTTTTDGQPLQTAGMVFMKATAAGRPLQVAAGRTVRLELPAPNGRPLTDMRLYYGQSTTTPVRWEKAPEMAAPVSETAETIYTDARPMPAYGSGPADINRLIRYPQEALASRTQGVVFASFVVDEGGKVLNPKILYGLGHGCDEEVLRVLRQTSGRWTPGQRNGEFVKVKMMLPIRFSFNEGQLTATDSTPASGQEAPVMAAASLPTAASEEAAAAPEPTDRYVFHCSQLGWFNADRPVSGATSSYQALSSETDATTSVRLVMRGATPSVLVGQPTETGYQFDNVPAGRRAILIGLRYQGGTPYLAWQETTTGQESTPLEFQETTLEELERRLERL
ncbi:energy transducer TonB [Microvirga sp. STR05]|uniref:Energy transducer TonB n=1 Tax=Hymenobacter duratus TaxID=2771356 RepID=A0ABR8JDK4_9BACT|nr:energy transducer TonB [Hymenobacter duratus]MBD2713628.1 energy transducer TonB [Hymenobacter duratus]MBR7948530.1 energy transducer TonB [Microvirga sp. STR05]